MKRIVSLVLALSMVLSMFSMSFAGKGLKDVKGTEYEAAVEALIELGIVTGYPDETYLPNNVVTRAELAKLLVVAYNLESAAEASKGTTPFADVNAVANHWASGYINVSADYKFINGYPDGSFKGDETVTYAEAVTMCLRVLGYANEIDAKGTWPSNYIAKAQDLEMLKGINYKNINDGAKRGDIALLIWNMLTTKMWTAQSESEGDGLLYAPTTKMLSIKFPDYIYFDSKDEVTFDGFVIEEDKKEEKAVVKMSVNGTYYEYAGNDFYTFVPGTEVEALINKEKEVLLTMVPTTSNKLVEGNKEAYEKDYGYNVESGEDLSEVAFDHIYANIERKDAIAYTVINTSSVYVDEIEIDNDDEEILINDEEKDADDVEYYDYQYSEIVLKDGERTKLSELSVGDVLTTVTVAYDGASEDYEIGRFHVIGTPEEVEGEFVRLATVKFEDCEVAEFKQLTVDKNKYPVDDNATYVEDTTEDPVTATELGTGLPDMETEEIVAKLDPVTGKVVRIEFDGEINGSENEETTFGFFGIDSIFGVDTSSKKDYKYVVDLLSDSNDPEEDTKIGKNTDAADMAADYADRSDDTLIGSFVAVEMNEDGEIIDIQVIADRNGSGDLTDIVYGESGDNEVYTMVYMASASHDEEDEKNYVVSGNTKVLVSDNTILVKLVFDDNGTINDPTDDEYRVEFSEGISAISKVDDENAIVVIDTANEFQYAKYVVIWDDLSDNSGNKVSVLKDSNESEVLVGGGKIELEDEDDILTIADNAPSDLDEYELFVYKVVERENGKNKFNFVAGLTSGDLSVSGDRSEYVYTVSNDKTLYKLDDSDSEYLTMAKFVEDHEDYMFVSVEVKEDKDNAGKYEITDYEEITNSEVAGEFKPVVSANGTLKDEAKTVHTRYIVDTDAKVVFIINGMLKK